MARNKIPTERDDWNKNEKSNVRIALNIKYAEKEKICTAYVSKDNSNCQKQIILLMERNDIILQQKKLFPFLRGRTSKHQAVFFCLNYLYSFATEKTTWIA